MVYTRYTHAYHSRLWYNLLIIWKVEYISQRVTLKSAGTNDGTVYAGQPAVHMVRRVIAAAVFWLVVLYQLITCWRVTTRCDRCNKKYYWCVQLTVISDQLIQQSNYYINRRRANTAAGWVGAGVNYNMTGQSTVAASARRTRWTAGWPA